MSVHDEVLAYRAARPVGERTVAVTQPAAVVALALALLRVPDVRVVASPLVPAGQVYLMPDPDDQPLLPPPSTELGDHYDRIGPRP